MEDDERAESERQKREDEDVLSHLVLRVTVDEFEDWSRAALQGGMIITDWSIAAIRAAYQAEMRATLDGLDALADQDLPAAAPPNVGPMLVGMDTPESNGGLEAK